MALLKLKRKFDVQKFFQQDRVQRAQTMSNPHFYLRNDAELSSQVPVSPPMSPVAYQMIPPRDMGARYYNQDQV